MNLGYTELNEEKDCFWDVIIAAIAFVPGWGPVASAALTVGKSSIPVLKKHSDLRRIHDELTRVNMTVKVRSYKEDALCVISDYLKSMNKDSEKAPLSEYFIRDNSTELADVIFKKFETKCQLPDDDLKQEIQIYIRDIINCLLDVDKITVLTSNDQIVKDLMEVMRELSKNNIEFRNKLEELEAKVVEHHKVNDSNADTIIDDNEVFVKKYTSTELFLDKGTRKIYLSNVYVSPIIEGNDVNTDLDNQLKEWNKKSSKTREYTDADAPVLLLYGKAGIGKSSLVAKLISDNFFNDAAHAIILNKKAELFDYEDPWGSIKRIYGCENDICYDNKVLILDGFDEVCVLKNNDFKGHVFLQKLASSIPSTVFVKVLITSRESSGYFEKIDEEKGSIIIRYVGWNEDLLFQWCENYLNSRDGDKTVEQWVDDFKVRFYSLEEKLQDAFYSPIILYICCHENIRIFEMDSITEVYYKAFHKVTKRDYITSDKSGELSKIDERTEKMLWQYLKEIAFQIFLASNHSDTAEKPLIDKARSFMEEYNECIKPNVFEVLPAVFHFSSSNDDGGIVFVHKTVAEYFIAVKIFEDYFKNINAKTDDEKVWDSIYSALSLRKVPIDIIKHICAMMTSSDPSVSGKFDKEAFFIKFESGMKQEMILKSPINAEEKYLICSKSSGFDVLDELSTSLKSDRIRIAISNLMWLLNELGYTNKSFTLLFKYLSSYLDQNLNLSDMYLNSILYPETEAIIYAGPDCYADCTDEIAEYIKRNENKWKTTRNDVKNNIGPAEIIFPIWNYKNLSGCYFQNTHMEYIHIENSNLSWCHFENAYLHGASFKNSDISRSYLNDSDCSNANFENADLSFSYLTNTNLKNANLKGVDFTGAYLIGADLTGADLENAIFDDTYCNSKTIFPEGFEPDSNNIKQICCGAN